MPEENNNENGTIGSEMSVLESMLSTELRLVKKYLLDSQGRLRLYHPVIQRIIFQLLKGESITEDTLLDEVKRYHKAKKEEIKREKKNR